MTYTMTLSDSLTTQAIVRLDPSPGRRTPLPVVLSVVRHDPPVEASTDEASLSHESLLIAHALTLSDVRMEKVARLQDAIAAGTYRIPSDHLADTIIQDIRIAL